jgi:hypothetical protein
MGFVANHVGTVAGGYDNAFAFTRQLAQLRKQTSTIFTSLGNVHRFIGDQLAAMQHTVSCKICAICLSAI